MGSTEVVRLRAGRSSDGLAERWSEKIISCQHGKKDIRKLFPVFNVVVLLILKDRVRRGGSRTGAPGIETTLSFILNDKVWWGGGRTSARAGRSDVENRRRRIGGGAPKLEGEDGEGGRWWTGGGGGAGILTALSLPETARGSG